MEILNVKINRLSKKQFKELIVQSLVKSGQTKISKINTEFIQRCQDNKRFLDVINVSDINLVDGRGVLWAARYLTLPISDNNFIRYIQAVWQMVYSGFLIVLRPKFITYPIPTAIPGVEALNLIMRVAADSKTGVFLFGSSKKALDLAVRNIKKRFPELKIAGSLDGYSFQKDSSIDPVVEINRTNAKILIVALGSPKQEYWINDNIGRLTKVKIAVGEGGTLDRVAHPAHKAPKCINLIGLEWLWRSFVNKSRTETRNRFQKFWKAVPSFIGRVVKWKIRYGQAQI
jgi:N-acetylglucosaminyldiphosphoundecaprenol N-acetyl-beta-D-mannosaminyltransferase